MLKAADLEIGKLYTMHHVRKGTAVVRCLEVREGGGRFEVVKGELRGINDYYGPGDEIRTANDLAHFTRRRQHGHSKRTGRPDPSLPGAAA